MLFPDLKREIPGSAQRGLEPFVQGAFAMKAHLLWVTEICLEVQGSYNQAISAITNYFYAP